MNIGKVNIKRFFNKVLLEIYKLLYIKKYLFNNIYIPFIFKLFSLFPVKKDFVLFAINRLNELPYNMELIYNLCINNGYKCKLFFTNNFNQQKNKIIIYFKQFYHAFCFSKYYARCSYLIVDDYFPYLYSNKPRKGVKVVQLWHGCGAFKKFGYSCVEKNWGFSKTTLSMFPIHNTYTDVFVSSSDVIQYYAEAFNCSPSIIKSLGVPRTDFFFNKNNIYASSIKLKKMFPEIKERKVILYAPTFRGNNAHDSYLNNFFNYKLLSSSLSDEYVLLTKYHPFTNKVIKSESKKDYHDNFVYDVTNKINIEDALCASDIVITDYSSLIFEFSLLERPMIFFAFDLEEYDTDRGFYFPYQDFVPGPIVMDNESLVNAIINAYSDENMEKVKIFRDKFMSSCDGNSTERIYNYIFNKKEKG